MKDGWKQVSKQEYEVLSCYHLGEERYYIDFNTVIPRKRTVVRSDASQPRANAGIPNGPNNKKLGLGVGQGKALPDGSVRKAVWESAKRCFRDDLKEGLPRNALLASIMNDTGLGKDRVQPQITALLDQKFLRVIG